MDGLLAVLRDHAATLKDFATPQMEWEVKANSNSTVVTARTKLVAADPDVAWHAAKELRDRILALGYKLHGDCTVGVASEIGEDPPDSDDYVLPIVGWRGFVDLVFDTDLSGQLDSSNT